MRLKATHLHGHGGQAACPAATSRNEEPADSAAQCVVHLQTMQVCSSECDCGCWASEMRR